jgi:hypothetical protein
MVVRMLLLLMCALLKEYAYHNIELPTVEEIASMDKMKKLSLKKIIAQEM